MRTDKKINVDVDLITDLYVNKQYSTTKISKLTSISCSTIRLRLIENGVNFRTISCAQKLITDRSWSKKKRVFTEEWKQNIRLGKLRHADKTAIGYSLKPNGYYEITRGKNKGRMLHIVIYEEYYGIKIKKGYVVHHINGIRNDNRINNLMLMTRSEHSRYHCIKNHNEGKLYNISIHSKKGENHPMSKLTESNVIEIIKSDMPTKYLCNKFGVKKSAIDKIRRRESWKCITIN